MVLTIITVSYNAEAYIRRTIDSVLAQDYKEIEYIIVDGGSTDRTMEIVLEYHNNIACIISEPDQGLYDAMNKGLSKATGDIVGFLNADDYYPTSDILSRVSRHFEDKSVGSVFGDVFYVDSKKGKITRHYSSGGFRLSHMPNGFMPAHPTYFTWRKNYLRYGGFKLNYKIGADFELLLRFLYIHGINFFYDPKILVYMERGGISNRSIRNHLLNNQENLRACLENNVPTSYARICLKYYYKLKGFLVKRPVV